MHVDASPHYVRALQVARPDELVIHAAVATTAGTITLYEFAHTGLSTVDVNIARRQQLTGRSFRSINVPCLTLDDIFSEVQTQEIHWLKIDIEGSENSAIESWKTSTIRPWIVVIEATMPNSPEESHLSWEPKLFAKGYDFVYFDGLNRFYVSHAHSELKKYFGAGPNFFDDFALSGNATSPFCAVVNDRMNAAVNDSVKEIELERDASREALDKLEAAFAESELEAWAQTVELQKALADRDRQLALEHQHRLDAEADKKRLLDSLSWKATRPLRELGRTPRNIFRLLNRFGRRRPVGPGIEHRSGDMALRIETILARVERE